MMIDADRYRFDGLTPIALPELDLDVEICSCDEALALRVELARVRARGRRGPPLDARAEAVLAAWGGASDGLD